jgi:hypothetical protein
MKAALTFLYGGVLLSTPLHASSNFTVSVQLANKRGLKKLQTKKNLVINVLNACGGNYDTEGVQIRSY